MQIFADTENNFISRNSKFKILNLEFEFLFQVKANRWKWKGLENADLCWQGEQPGGNSSEWVSSKTKGFQKCCRLFQKCPQTPAKKCLDGYTSVS